MSPKERFISIAQSTFLHLKADNDQKDVEIKRLTRIVKRLLREISEAEGDYGIGLAMTRAEKAIGWSVLDLPTAQQLKRRRGK